MRILIVEDSPELAKIIARYVSGLSTDIIIAESMAEADAVISRANPFDLVTLDLNLPDSRVDETLVKIMDIKRTNPDCLLVVVTGVVRPEEEARIINSGADGYMHKSDFMGRPGRFLQTLSDICRSVAKTPTRYTKNVALLEIQSASLARWYEDADLAPGPSLA